MADLLYALICEKTEETADNGLNLLGQIFYKPVQFPYKLKDLVIVHAWNKDFVGHKITFHAYTNRVKHPTNRSVLLDKAIGGLNDIHVQVTAVIPVEVSKPCCVTFQVLLDDQVRHSIPLFLFGRKS